MQDLVNKYMSDPVISKLVTLVIGIIIIWVIIKILGNIIPGKIKDNSIRYKTKKTITFTGYILVVLLVLFTYSNKLGGITVAFGIAGAGIAFALQEVIASFAGWLAILFGGFYKTGDRVQLGGIKGDVMDIGLLRTTVMETGQWVDGDLYNGRIVLIANSFVFKEPVFNYSGDFPFLWDEIKVPIQYGSDYDKVNDILLRAGNEIAENLTEVSRKKWEHLQYKYRLEDAQISPMVSLIANDNWVEFTLRYVVTYNKRRSTKTRLFTYILKEIDNTNGAIKMASATFDIVGVPGLNVNLGK